MKVTLQVLVTMLILAALAGGAVGWLVRDYRAFWQARGDDQT
jgi:hypothetical protein